jgi:3-methyladenine DNA glycosylase AlkD
MDWTSLLKENSEKEYASFQAKLIPNVEKDKILGVRLPILRKIAKESEVDYEFLSKTPHKYLEENMLHAFFIEKIKDYDLCISETEKFLPFVDNWAVCDTFSPKVFATSADKIHQKAIEWIKSDREYTVRYGIITLMRYFLGQNRVEDFILVANIKREEYYVKTAIAWYFATAIAKDGNSAIKVLESKTLDKWTHNKTIKKAIESFRVEKSVKEYLKTLLIK